MIDTEWLEYMAREFKPARCEACGNPLQFARYPSTEFWTGCGCWRHIPQCLGRDEDYEVRIA